MEIKVNIIAIKRKFGVTRVWSALSYIKFKYSKLQALQALLIGKFIIFALGKKVP
jgi:hypothetical protein